MEPAGDPCPLMGRDPVADLTAFGNPLLDPQDLVDPAGEGVALVSWGLVTLLLLVELLVVLVPFDDGTSGFASALIIQARLSLCTYWKGSAGASCAGLDCSLVVLVAGEADGGGWLVVGVSLPLTLAVVGGLVVVVLSDVALMAAVLTTVVIVVAAAATAPTPRVEGSVTL